MQISFLWIYPVHENYSGQAALRRIVIATIVHVTAFIDSFLCHYIVGGASSRNTKVNFLAGGEIVAVIRSRKVAAKQGYNPEWWCSWDQGEWP